MEHPTARNLQSCKGCFMYKDQAIRSYKGTSETTVWKLYNLKNIVIGTQGLLLFFSGTIGTLSYGRIFYVPYIFIYVAIGILWILLVQLFSLVCTEIYKLLPLGDKKKKNGAFLYALQCLGYSTSKTLWGCSHLAGIDFDRQLGFGFPLLKFESIDSLRYHIKKKN